MKSWILAVLVIAVVAAVALTFFMQRKEKYTNTMFLDQPRLRPVLRGENSETMDVLAYSLGGLSKPRQKSC
jgi:LPS O-antigen subunit length determinant protein (WzzB/FepE family)